MSEPNKKPNQAPKSYSPAKPEILSMAEVRAGKAVVSGNMVYIDGAPPVKSGEWGDWRSCTYSGCMTLLLNAMGAKTTYERVMGLTGSCYRASMAYGWDPGSNILDIAYANLKIGSRENANRLYGMDSRLIEAEKITVEEREALVRESIEAGVPVLILNKTPGPAEWGILLGYEKNPDGFKYFGRSFFDDNYYGVSYLGDSAPKDKIFTTNRYVLAFDFPNDIFCVKLFNGYYDPAYPRAALKISLEACLEMFAPHEKFGYGAYDMMIKSFMDNKFVSDWHGDGDIYTIFVTMTDARRAAHIYLEESAELLPGNNKDDLYAVSSLYKNMFDIFLGLINDYDFSESLKRLDTYSRLTSSEETRINIAEKLRRCKDLEYKAHDIVKKILENWVMGETC